MNSGIQSIFNTRSVVGNLIIINVLCFLAIMVFGTTQYGGYALNVKLGLHLPGSEYFRPWQILTHMFMHGSFFHLLFNMYALWLFGQSLEQVWGSRRFLIYYMVCGLGAAVIFVLTRYWELSSMGLAAEVIMNHPQNFAVGASGAVFGLLLGYGMLFPNTQLMMLFIPFPIKAKYFVMFYAAAELFMGVNNNPGDNVAHFAHLGGMLFGIILIKLWGKNRNNFY